MITVYVEFSPTEPIPVDRFAELAAENARANLGRLGLLSKNYVRSADGMLVGGIYVWSTRHAAETHFDEAWHARVTEAYGSAPSFRWFDSPLVLDNRHREILD